MITDEEWTDDLIATIARRLRSEVRLRDSNGVPQTAEGLARAMIIAIEEYLTQKYDRAQEKRGLKGRDL